MKILLILLTLFATSNISVNESNQQSVDSGIIVTIQYLDGNSSVYSLEEFNEINTKTLIKDVFSCTYEFAGGECRTTASTCSAAAAGFCACAGKLRYETVKIKVCG